MANIVPKLNLNRTPAIIENNSLVFAKNIRLDADGTIHKDYSIEPLHSIKSDENTENYNNIFDKIIYDFKQEQKDNKNDKGEVIDSYLDTLLDYYIDKVNTKKDNIIVNVIPNNTEFFILGYNITTSEDKKTINSYIIRYDETTNMFYPCNCNWNYENGIISGYVINNLLNEKILIIAEKSDIATSLKCINLAKSKYTDTESFYTQTPYIPITNLIFDDYFNYSIPNGVYQFFIRYKIRDGFYTNWFPASKELFIGNDYKTVTIFGTLKYINTHIDSNKSFKFNVEHLINEYKTLYKYFQIGFIVSHDDGIYGRIWKEFDINTTNILFDYNSLDAEEIEITEFTKPIFNIYNVGNICSFKNKLYISNYEETNFNNPKILDCINDITINIKSFTEGIGYGDYEVETTEDNYIKKIKVDTNFETIDNIVLDLYNKTELSNKIIYYDYNTQYKYINKNDISIQYEQTSLTNLKNKIKSDLVNNKNISLVSFDDKITNIIINDKLIDISIDSINNTINEIINSIQYISPDGNFTNSSYDILDTITITYVRQYSYYIKYKTYGTTIKEFKNEINTDKITEIPGYYINEKINKTYNQTLTIKFKAYKNKIKTTNLNKINYTTLIPYQKYKFYVHFVKNTGEYTNGYVCNNDKPIECPYKKEVNEIIYPSFDNITIPEGYVACFFSILLCENKTATIFNVKEVSDAEDTINEGSSIDVNLLLYGNTKSVKIQYDTESDAKSDTKSNTNKLNGQYYFSSDVSKFKYFGADGVITFPNKDINNTTFYIVNEYIADTLNPQLIKCTPYINTESYDNYNDLNLLGYICIIYPLDRDTCKNYYSDGSTVYYKTVSSDIYGNFTEVSKYLDGGEGHRVKDINLKTTTPFTIYSNYNLNYVSLSDEPKQVSKTYYNYNSNETVKGTGTSILWRLLTSLTLSNVYTLPSMYKNYTRKTYNIYTTDNFTTFNNTIRSSKLAGDEDKISIFEFDADEYYNIPTNRGKITNLVSVGDSILVHTQDSMFKFTGSNTLQSNTGEIQQTETDIFQTGVSEIFGSDFGFAGLQNKNAAITTEAGYIFYDGDSKVIYMYSGNGQIVKLSNSIEKLLRYDEILNVNFANDYYNNRFFTCIHFKNKDVTLSYSFNEESKSFISLHDFSFNKAFNTKTKCYFITKKEKDNTFLYSINTINKHNFGVYYNMELTNFIYPQVSNNSKTFNDTLEFDSIIDIIENTNYENIKTLNWINWNSSIIENEFPIYSNDSNYFNALASTDTPYPCKKITIYTDTCSTDILDCSTISNDKSITNINTSPYYKYPRYNQGFWTLNYFRNVLNANDKFKYLEQKYDNKINASYRSDDNSLIEGKYFVTRFTFDSNKDFKLETINFNYDIKL